MPISREWGQDWVMVRLGGARLHRARFVPAQKVIEFGARAGGNVARVPAAVARYEAGELEADMLRLVRLSMLRPEQWVDLDDPESALPMPPPPPRGDAGKKYYSAPKRPARTG